MRGSPVPWGVLLGAVLVSGACGEAAPSSDAAPDGEGLAAPSFSRVFPPVPGELMSLSSPSLEDLDGDGTPDIVFGTGVDRLRPQDDGTWRHSSEPEVPGYVTAVSGATNEVLWKAPHTGEAYSTPRFLALDGDGVPDVVAGGREGALAAFSGADGSLIWRADPAGVATTPVPYNFSTPALTEDLDGDGITDFVVAYGGDPTRVPGDPRDPGFVVVMSGADGTPLAVHETPDGAEIYSSVVLYERSDGTPWVVFGTGGETNGGAAFRAPLASLLDGSFPRRVERLTEPGGKGVMAPATLVEITGDEEVDIVVSTFDGRLVAVDGASGDVLWEQSSGNEESYQPAAVVRTSPDGRLALALSRGVGVFPAYTGSSHRLLDARDGSVLYQYWSAAFPAGAPLAVDLTDDGVDEVFFFSDPGLVHILHVPSRRLVVHDLGTNFSATPRIADPRDGGTLELIGIAWQNRGDPREIFDWRNLGMQLLRLELDAEPPEFLAWAGYMGTESDGSYRPAEPGS